MDKDINGTLVATALLVGAFLLRCKIGFRRLHDQKAYIWQKVLFLLGIFFLLQLDALTFVFGMHPEGAPKDIVIWLVAYAIYLSFMALSLFPFRAKQVSEADDLAGGS